MKRDSETWYERGQKQALSGLNTVYEECKTEVTWQIEIHCAYFNLLSDRNVDYCEMTKKS